MSLNKSSEKPRKGAQEEGNRLQVKGNNFPGSRLQDMKLISLASKRSVLLTAPREKLSCQEMV